MNKVTRPQLKALAIAWLLLGAGYFVFCVIAKVNTPMTELVFLLEGLLPSRTLLTYLAINVNTTTFCLLVLMPTLHLLDLSKFPSSAALREHDKNQSHNVINQDHLREGGDTHIENTKGLSYELLAFQLRSNNERDAKK
jgi:hypothetical protein